ncbi:MAG: exonuclease III [Methylibium sp.]|nr:exonuclease III [Methylibium sp.]
MLPAQLPRIFALIPVFAALAAPAQAAIPEPLRIASWNLGWHVALAEQPNWAAKCGLHYARDEAAGVWKPVAAGTPGATLGWDVRESRAQLQGVDLSVMPPCGVYQGANREGLTVTPGALAARNTRIAKLLAETVRPDVIAFQEVSGTAAVREALGAQAGQYEVCSFDGRYKVQRLAFAWRKSLGEGQCELDAGLVLAQLPPAEQLRPALTLTLKRQGQVVRFMTLHLKSGCVTPLDGRGKLDQDQGPKDPCPALQQQVAPLEAAVEKLGQGADHFVVLGDFNRNLWHDAQAVDGAKPVRSDTSTDLTTPLPVGVKTQNLYREVFDGKPAATELVALDCTGPGGELCQRSKTEAVGRRDLAPLVANLGCRNPIGLDHFVVSASLTSKLRGAQKISIGAEGQSRAAAPGEQEPVLGVSDHCPIVLQLGF